MKRRVLTPLKPILTQEELWEQQEEQRKAEEFLTGVTIDELEEIYPLKERLNHTKKVMNLRKRWQKEKNEKVSRSKIKRKEAAAHKSAATKLSTTGNTIAVSPDNDPDIQGW